MATQDPQTQAPESINHEDRFALLRDGPVTPAKLRQVCAEGYAAGHVNREPLAGEALALGLDYKRADNPLGEWILATNQMLHHILIEGHSADATVEDFAKATRRLKLEIWHRRLFGLETRPRLPIERSLSLAISLDKPKTSSLIVDRIWKPAVHELPFDFGSLQDLPIYPGQYIELLKAPDSICFCLGDMFETPFAGAVVGSALQSLAILYQGSLIAALGRGTLPDLSISPEHQKGHFAFPEQFLSMLVGRKLGRAAPSLLATVAERDAAYKGGREIALVSVLEGLPLPIESALSWEQVMEIRTDPESRDRLRRFALWLDSVLPSKSSAQINDNILVKLEDYRRALSKHGVETRLGIFERVVSWQPMLAKLAAAGAGSAVGEPILGLIGAGSIALGEICVALQKTKLALEEVHRKHEDVSFVFELERATGSKNTDNNIG